MKLKSLKQHILRCFSSKVSNNLKFNKKKTAQKVRSINKITGAKAVKAKMKRVIMKTMMTKRTKKTSNNKFTGE